MLNPSASWESSSVFIISLVVFLVLFYWFKEFIDKEFPLAHKKTLGFLSFLSIIFLIFARILLDLEYNNYPNYLYSLYGITISHLEFMSFIAALELLSFMSLLVYSASFNYKSINKLKRYGFISSKLNRASFFVAILGFSGLLILSANTFLNWNKLSSGEKGGYESRIGRHYKYLVLLTNNTPSDANIIHPPQGDKWPAIGNQPIIRYFLYPRTLISGVILKNQEFASEVQEAYFVEIDKLFEESHWPIIDKFGKTIIFDEDNKIKYTQLEIIYESEDGSVFKILF